MQAFHSGFPWRRAQFLICPHPKAADYYAKKAAGHDKWLRQMIAVAKEEYEVVWMGKTKPNARQVYHGLSRYYDFNYLHEIAETESGWDMTPRFEHRALNFLPVDLNALLYKYETDFARAARIFGDKREAARWDGGWGSAQLGLPRPRRRRHPSNRSMDFWGGVI